MGERRDHHILRVGEDVFADPRDGEERSRVIIDADDWCNVVPITRDDTVVMVKQFRFGTRDVSLEFPGGIVAPGEDPGGSAARELEEETGYRAGRLEPLGGYSPNPAHFTNRVHVFIAFDCEPAHDGTPDEGEDLRTVLVPRAAVRELVTEGRIANAMHIATAALAIFKGHL
jgi:ADP-ribose pyrophosphatase